MPTPPLAGPSAIPTRSAHDATRNPHPSGDPPPGKPPDASAAVAPELVPEQIRQQLPGRWQRTDAEYAIEIRLITEDGLAEARYFNPFNQRAINVARASVAASFGGRPAASPARAITSASRNT